MLCPLFLSFQWGWGAPFYPSWNQLPWATTSSARHCLLWVTWKTPKSFLPSPTPSIGSQEEVAKQRGVTLQTVCGHLAEALEAGYFVDYRKCQSILSAVLLGNMILNELSLLSPSLPLSITPSPPSLTPFLLPSLLPLSLFLPPFLPPSLPPGGLTQELEELITSTIRKEPISSGEWDEGASSLPEREWDG